MELIWGWRFWRTVMVLSPRYWCGALVLWHGKGDVWAACWSMMARGGALRFTFVTGWQRLVRHRRFQLNRLQMHDVHFNHDVSIKTSAWEQLSHKSNCVLREEAQMGNGQSERLQLVWRWRRLLTARLHWIVKHTNWNCHFPARTVTHLLTPLESNEPGLELNLTVFRRARSFLSTLRRAESRASQSEQTDWRPAHPCVRELLHWTTVNTQTLIRCF